MKKLLSVIKGERVKGVVVEPGLKNTVVPKAYIKKFIYNDLGKMGLKKVDFS